MSTRRLQTGDEQKLEHFLSDYIETSMFLLSNARRSGLEYQNKEYHGEYFSAFDEVGNIVGVLAHYWNGNIIVQTNESVLSDLITAFRSAVTRPIVGILGLEDLVKIVIKELGLAGEDYAKNQSEWLYALNLNTLSSPESFDLSRAKMIEASKVDRSILTRWTKAYEIEALGSDNNEALDKHVKSRVDQIFNGLVDCWVLLVDGEPVSLSGFNAQLPDIVQIGPVWTPPEHRNRGYARTLVALTLQKAKEHGVEKAILFTDNPAAAKAYEAIGFRKIGSYLLALLKKPTDLNRRS